MGENMGGVRCRLGSNFLAPLGGTLPASIDYCIQGSCIITIRYTATIRCTATIRYTSTIR